MWGFCKIPVGATGSAPLNAIYFKYMTPERCCLNFFPQFFPTSSNFTLDVRALFQRNTLRMTLSPEKWIDFAQGVFSVCYAIAAVSTGLRLYVRRFMTLRHLQLDDYLLIGSFVCISHPSRSNVKGTFTVSIVLSLFMVSNDVLHLENASMDQIRQNLKVFNLFYDRLTY